MGSFNVAEHPGSGLGVFRQLHLLPRITVNAPQNFDLDVLLALPNAGEQAGAPTRATAHGRFLAFFKIPNKPRMGQVAEQEAAVSRSAGLLLASYIYIGLYYFIVKAL